MAIKGTLYGLAKTKNDVDGLEKFKSMIKEVNSSGAVVIDGRNIAADSIFANQISADAITAKQIKAGTITTDHITTSGISADKIKAGQLTAQNNASWLNLNNGQFSFGGGKIVYNGSNLSINVESLKITNKPVATQDDAQGFANSAVDGLEIGGRNLMRYSDDIFTRPSGNTNISFIGQNIPELVIGEDYTFSVELKADVDTKLSQAIFINSSNRPSENIGSTVSKDWKRYVFHFKWAGGNYSGNDVHVHIYFNSIAGNFYARHPKIEKGTKATDWTPAPEDVDDAINAAQTDATNAKGKTDAWTYTGTTEINGGKIKADTVTATQIAANTITANQIATNAITADKILAKSIIAGKIAANAVTAEEIKAGTITAKEIAAGTLTANEIKAGAITVDKIAVGDFTNYAAWDKTAGTYPLQSGALDTSVFRSSRGSIKLSPGQTGNLKSDIEVVYGESIYYEFWVKTDTNWNGTANISKFRIGDQNNGLLFADIYNGPKTSWTKFSGNYTVASSVYALKMSFGNDGTVGNVWIDDVVIKKKTSGELIVNGSITADHITTLGITADKIKAGRLSATNNVSWLDMNNGQFNFGNGKISFNGSVLALNVDSLSIASKPVATKEQVDASILDDKKIKDTRSTNQPPSWYFTNYPTQVVNEFKQRTTVGAPGKETYGVLTTDVIWSSTSGGFITQTFKSGDGVFTRNGQTTGWTAWLQIDIEDRINNAVTTIDKTGVTVKDGSFYLQDNSSDVKYSLQAKTNPIKDHGFEMYSPKIKHSTYDIWEPDVYGNSDSTSSPKTDSDVYRVGGAYVYVNLTQDFTSNSSSTPIFGSVSGVVNNASYYFSKVSASFKPGVTYTASAFFKKVPGMTAGIPRIIVQHTKINSGAIIATIADSTFQVVSSEIDPSRYSVKFVVPANYNTDSDTIKMSYLSSNGNWIMVDGLQVVDGVYPNQYDEEKTAFQVARGQLKFPILSASQLAITGPSFMFGDVTVSGQFEAGRYVSRELKANEDLNNIKAEGWYHCALSATAATIKNTPSNMAFSVFVEKHAGTKQTFTTYDAGNPKMWIRNEYGGWGGWKVAIDDSGWRDLSLRNLNGGNLRYRFMDGKVNLNGWIAKVGEQRSGLAIANLPTWASPAADTRFLSTSFEGHTSYPEQHACSLLLKSSDGELSIQRKTGVERWYINETFMV